MIKFRALICDGFLRSTICSLLGLTSPVQVCCRQRSIARITCFSDSPPWGKIRAFLFQLVNVSGRTPCILIYCIILVRVYDLFGSSRLMLFVLIITFLVLVLVNGTKCIRFFPKAILRTDPMDQSHIICYANLYLQIAMFCFLY